MASKILVVGPIQGHIEKAFQKIAKLNSKTSFAFALIVGDLFGDDAENEAQALLSGSVNVPLPTYFTVGNTALPQAVQKKLESTGEICSNLFYLGRKGTLTTTEGIRIVFLGGRQVQNEESMTQSIGKYDPLFLENEARVLQGANNAHIILSNQWPARIENGSSVPIPDGIDTNTSVAAISNLCAHLKPRYHFSPSPTTCWKREPFMWPMEYNSDADTKITRFESMGNVTLKNSEWISAFTLDPAKPASTEGAQRSAPFTTLSPRGKRKRDALAPDAHPGRFDRSSNHYGGGRNKKRRGGNADPNDCFMCLGKPTFSADMVVSIGDESFLTSLRGPLPTLTTFPLLKSTGNLMIIPMYHAAEETAHGRRAASELQTEFDEMTHYRRALQHMLVSKCRRELGAVCWEVNRMGIRHFHWQWIACPNTLITKGLVDGAFKIAAEKNDYEKFQACEPDKLLPDRRSDYFRVWIWSPFTASPPANDTPKDDSAPGLHPSTPPSAASSPIAQADAISAGIDTDPQARTLPPQSTETSMYLEIPQDQRFNIQFGRTVMASLLKLEHRADWRSVPVEEGDEARDAEAWKEDLGEWDFAMA